MALNPYFTNYTYQPTQNLTEDLIIESIKIYGVEVYYLPRTQVNPDEIFKGDDMSTFDSAIPVEMYVKTVDGYEGQGDFLSAFGLQIQDRITFTVAKKRFEEELSSLEPLRPKEGDLIWFPMANDLFEINFVEHEEIFYQMGKLFTYSLACERFVYSNEEINTGNTAIDSVENSYSLSVNIALEPGTGDFIVGETVTGSLNGYTAEITAWDAINNTISIKNYSGKFANSEILTGDQSTTQRTVSVANYLDLTDSGAENDSIQDESDNIVDFTETDPFSEGFF